MTEPRVYAAHIKYLFISFWNVLTSTGKKKTNLMKRKPHSEQKRKHQRKDFVCSDVRGLTWMCRLMIA